MNRRKFLGGFAVGATGTLFSTSLYKELSPVQKEEPCQEKEPSTQPTSEPMPSLAEAIANARSIGKPLLVLIAPQDYQMRRHWGWTLGEFFNYASEEELIVLSLCEVYCALLPEVQALVEVSGEPLAVLIETDQPGLYAQSLDLNLLKSDRPQQLSRALFRALVGAASHEEHKAMRFEAFVSSLARREVQARLCIPKIDEAIQDCQHLGRPDPELADRIAAALYVSALTENRRSFLLLVQAVRARLCLEAPAKSRWAQDTFCSYSLEASKGEPIELPAAECGMGYAPVKSRRFLRFYIEGLEE